MSIFVTIISEPKQVIQPSKMCLLIATCRGIFRLNPHTAFESLKIFPPLVAYMKYREICADAIHQRYATTVAPVVTRENTQEK